MSLILKRRAYISFIYSKTIVIDIVISFGKWRGSQLVFIMTSVKYKFYNLFLRKRIKLNIFVFYIL
jgi:hypothetical protein